MITDWFWSLLSRMGLLHSAQSENVRKARTGVNLKMIYDKDLKRWIMPGQQPPIQHVPASGTPPKIPTAGPPPASYKRGPKRYVDGMNMSGPAAQEPVDPVSAWRFYHVVEYIKYVLLKSLEMCCWVYMFRLLGMLPIGLPEAIQCCIVAVALHGLGQRWLQAA